MIIELLRKPTSRVPSSAFETGCTLNSANQRARYAPRQTRWTASRKPPIKWS